MTEAVTLPPQETEGEDAPVPTRRLLVFEVGRAAFASEMESFREIVPTRRFTRLPGAPDTVRGLINLRGSIVTVIDGGIALGMAPCVGEGGLTLLFGCAGMVLGVGVDDVREIQDVPIDRFLEAGAGEIPGRECVTAAVEIDGARVLVLDIKSVARQIIGQRR